MSLVATLKEIRTTGAENLQRYNPHRPVMVDGSLSELVTRALNLAYSKRDFTTGEPNFGDANPNGEAPRGASGLNNIFAPDSPKAQLIKPSLEGMQQMQAAQINAAAIVLAQAIDVHNRKHDETVLSDKPLLVYAIPEDGMITEEMNSDITAYGNNSSIDPADFVFIHTDKNDNLQDDVRVVNTAQLIKDYENRGARVYGSLESFLSDFESLRARR